VPAIGASGASADELLPFRQAMDNYADKTAYGKAYEEDEEKKQEWVVSSG